jgi:hypothetical protein
VSAAAVAQTLQQCMNDKVSALAAPTTEKVVSGQGCTTSGTEFVVKLNYQGWKQHSCDEDVCWSAPPDRVITDATAIDASGNGDQHTVGAVSYLPEKDNATKVCVHVHALSRDHSQGSRGWQKVDINATTRHVPTPDEMINAAQECVKAGAK